MKADKPTRRVKAVERYGGPIKLSVSGTAILGAVDEHLPAVVKLVKPRRVLPEFESPLVKFTIPAALCTKEVLKEVATSSRKPFKKPKESSKNQANNSEWMTPNNLTKRRYSSRPELTPGATPTSKSSNKADHRNKKITDCERDKSIRVSLKPERSRRQKEITANEKAKVPKNRGRPKTVDLTSHVITKPLKRKVEHANNDKNLSDSSHNEVQEKSKQRKSGRPLRWQDCGACFACRRLVDCGKCAPCVGGFDCWLRTCCVPNLRGSGQEQTKRKKKETNATDTTTDSGIGIALVDAASPLGNGYPQKTYTRDKLDDIESLGSHDPLAMTWMDDFDPNDVHNDVPTSVESVVAGPIPSLVHATALSTAVERKPEPAAISVEVALIDHASDATDKEIVPKPLDSEVVLVTDCEVSNIEPKKPCAVETNTALIAGPFSTEATDIDSTMEPVNGVALSAMDAKHSVKSNIISVATRAIVNLVAAPSAAELARKIRQKQQFLVGDESDEDDGVSDDDDDELQKHDVPFGV